MNYEKDFVTETLVIFKIDGREFTFKPTTGGDESEWLKDIMYINPETRIPQVDWGEYNKKKLANILSVPYDQETIKKIINVDMEWKGLNNDQRQLLLSKLRPGMMDQIVNEIKKIDVPDETALKN